MTESVVCVATSLGRNCFLQAPTGLFGGDLSWGINTYRSSSVAYDTSPAYRTQAPGKIRAAAKCR